MRASDTMRERTVARLRRGYAGGWLSTDTFERRVGCAYAAKEEPELAALVADLTRPRWPQAARAWLGGLVRPDGPRTEPVALRLSFPLAASAPVLIGRSSRCDLVLADPGVSRRHALVRHDEQGWAVKDLGSLNGTWLEGRRVGEAAVKAGDRLVLGSTPVVLALT